LSALCFYLARSGDHHALLSFPTRRSSDLTPLNWHIPQPVKVTGVDDVVVDGHKAVSVTISVNTAQSASEYAGVAPQTVVVTNQRSEEHTSELQSRENIVCRLLLEKKNRTQ